MAQIAPDLFLTISCVTYCERSGGSSQRGSGRWNAFQEALMEVRLLLDGHGNYTDKDLVYIAKSGDGQAFGELVRRHHRFCVGLAVRILRDRGDAEDETQNAYWSAFQHLHQFQGEAEFSAWLARIVSNHCLMLLRVRRRARFLHLDAAPPGSSRRRLDLPSWRLDPEGEAGNRQLREVLDQEIRRIPSLLREAVLLSNVQELPIGEVASRLGISVSCKVASSARSCGTPSAHPAALRPIWARQFDDARLPATGAASRVLIFEGFPISRDAPGPPCAPGVRNSRAARIEGLR